MERINQASGVILKRKKRRRLILFQILIVAGVVAAVWFSFGQNVLAPQIGLGIPERLGKLKLLDSVEGAEAMTQIDRLHGAEIELGSAYIARYADKNERVNVWVGKAVRSDIARDLLARMMEGIEKGGSGFSNLTRLSIAQGYHSHDVFQVDGPGGKHFFYISRKMDTQVVWLTIEAADSLPILEQALKTF